jgi:hypothetical protein
MAITMIRQDLILHFLVAFFLATVATAWLPPYTALIVAFVAGLLKEIYDIKKTGFDWKDLVLTTAGGFIAFWLRLIE